MDPMPFEIEGSGITAVASDPGPRALCSCGRGVDNPGAGVLVAFAGEGDAKMFRRRGQRITLGGTTEQIEMLVAELDGVRAYLQRDAQGKLQIVITKIDLYP
jgi:hypothetical protein